MQNVRNEEQMGPVLVIICSPDIFQSRIWLTRYGRRAADMRRWKFPFVNNISINYILLKMNTGLDNLTTLFYTEGEV
jgi:hypothetical protein